jgi:hypothetical protein
MRLHLEEKNKPLALRVYQQFLNTINDEKAQDTSPEIKELFR